MKDITWSNILSVGVDEIDEDHRKLIDTFNILSQSVAEGQPPRYLAAVLEELINCTAWHFSHEERLMLQYGYEGLEEHRAAHLELISSVRALQQDILEGNRAIADSVIEFLERWLTEHILTDDLKLGSFLSQEM